MKWIMLSKINHKIKFIKAKREDEKHTQKILENTIELKNNITNKNVINYIIFINNIDIPNKILCKNIISDVYKLIKNSDNINQQLKVDLRILLECKGVSFIY